MLARNILRRTNILMCAFKLQISERDGHCSHLFDFKLGLAKCLFVGNFLEGAKNKAGRQI